MVLGAIWNKRMLSQFERICFVNRLPPVRSTVAHFQQIYKTMYSVTICSFVVIVLGIWMENEPELLDNIRMKQFW